MSLEFSAVLLAGGRSSRMGRDKALLPHPVSGQPLIVHQATTLRAAGCAEWFLSVRTGADYTEIGPEVPRLVDDGEGGPLPVIQAALGRGASPLLVVLAVDLPFVGAELIRALVGQASDDCGVVVHGPGGFEPLCAVYPKAGFAAFSRARQGGRLGLQALLNDAVASGWMRAIDASDPAAFANWNRPEDIKLA